MASNGNVAFGDVNLAADPVRGKYAGSPGAGGWPSIRVYNKRTGYDGADAGDWKDANGHAGQMCDVFGDEDIMQSYVEEMAGVLLCTSGMECICKKRESGECKKVEYEYYKKFKDAPMADIESRLKLLAGSMDKSDHKDEWMKQRVAILRLITKLRQAQSGAADDKQEL